MRQFNPTMVLLVVLSLPAVSPAQMPTANTEPQQALDALDTRRPLPLLPMMADHQKQNMRDHLVAVQEIVAAVASEDFEAIAQAAGRIGYSAQMNQMCTQMGAGAPGFTDQALEFHRTADSIAASAKNRDRDGVLRALSATMKTCIGCHATWKQEVVDQANWLRLTEGAGNDGAHPASP